MNSLIYIYVLTVNIIDVNIWHLKKVEESLTA